MTTSTNISVNQNSNPIILKGIAVQTTPTTYPSRIYGMYDWNWDLNKWVINKSFYKKYIAT